MISSGLRGAKLPATSAASGDRTKELEPTSPTDSIRSQIGFMIIPLFCSSVWLKCRMIFGKTPPVTQ